MGIRRRSGAPAPAASPAVPDAEGQAAWDAGRGPWFGRRRRLLVAAALGLAALLLVAALVVTRAGGDGDVLALGPASDPIDLAPVDDEASLSDGLAVVDPVPAAPGGSAPGTAAGDPAAVAAGGATAAVVPSGAAAGTDQGGSGSGGGGGAPGPGAGAGIPTPTRPSGGGPTTTGALGTTTTAPPAQCAITDVSVNPNVVQSHRSQKLFGDVRVTFRPMGCGSGEFQVRGNGLDFPAFSTVDGFYDAIIRADAEKWSDGDHQLTITGGGATATAVLTVT